jgi:hypothetical protein
MVQRFVAEFVAPVRAWCHAHADKVRGCYFSVYESAPAVFVIGSVEGYDYSLSRPLADLEMELHRKGLSCSVLQLPPGNPALLMAFIDEAVAIQVRPEQTPGANHALS